MGVHVTVIPALLAKDFIKLLLVTIIIASPITWYVMDRRLGNFGYRINMDWWRL